MQYQITSDYGTFTITRIVDAASEDEAWEQTGVVATLEAAGWSFVDFPDGEDHLIEPVTA